MGVFSSFVYALAGTVGTLGTVLLGVAFAERLFGVVKPQPRLWLQAATFWLITMPAAAGSTILAKAVVRALHVHPLLSGHLLERVSVFGSWATPAASAAVALLAAVVGDFFFYWAHRFYHRGLWRIHSLHHSIRHLDALNSYHHVLEEALRALLVIVPAAFFTPLNVSAAPVVAVFIGIQGVFIHSASRINLGPLRWLIVDNRFHRIHHSLEARHLDKNFSAFTPVWDVIFGTAFFPANGDWPATGVSDIPEPDTIFAFVARPFLPGRPAEMTS